MCYKKLSFSNTFVMPFIKCNPLLRIAPYELSQVVPILIILSCKLVANLDMLRECVRLLLEYAVFIGNSKRYSKLCFEFTDSVVCSK